MHDIVVRDMTRRLEEELADIQRARRARVGPLRAPRTTQRRHLSVSFRVTVLGHQVVARLVMRPAD